ncbi:MAG: metal-dependent hydrolase [Halobacteriales archaeon]
MPDLLAHALIAYSVCTVLSWRYEWLTPAYVTAGMAGAFIPDMTKIRLVVPGEAIEAALGIPFSWSGIHTAGGAAVAVLVGTAIVAPRERRRIGTLLAVGAASHLIADAFLLTASGRSYEVLWPLLRYNPPTPGLYLSTQSGPTIVAGAVAAAVWLTTRRLRDREY